MKYVMLGHSGLTVSKVAYGAMTFAAEGAPVFAQADEKAASAIVHGAIDQGLNFFDTADVYSNTQSEVILGRVLGDRRADVVITTKGGARAGTVITQRGLSARHLLMSIDGSLKRLGTDWIDLYLCHLPDARTPLEETLMALDQIVRSGKARYIGFSNWPAWMAAKAVQMQKDHGWARFVAGQYSYNLLNRDIEHEIVPALIDAGVGIMCYSPLASGLLSGKYSAEDPTGGGGRLSQIKLLSDAPAELADQVVEALRDLAAKHSVPVAAVALAWLMEQPAVAAVLTGANNLEQMKQNLSAASVELTTEEMEALGALTQPQALYPASMFKWLGDGWADPRDRFKPVVPAQIGRWAPAKA